MASDRGILCVLSGLCVPAFLALWMGAVPLLAQAPPVTDYVVGAQDVLTITSYDQADLSGKFTLETDGTFSYPLIGRVKAGGLTLRALEALVKQRLKAEGCFNTTQVTVSEEANKRQRISIID